MNPAFWQGKRVLVTGHTGFKGGWLSIWLHKMGAQVHGYALAPSTDPSLFEVARVGQIVQSTLGDIRNQADLSAAVTHAQPEIVFHMAAQPLVRESYRDPLSTFETNVMGTARLLECVRQTPSVKAVVVVTSDKCYQNNEWHWGYREQDPLGGYDPYSASKACTELVAQAWQQSYFQSHTENLACSIATARAGNVIGGGDWSKDRLVPDILNSINNQQNIVLRNPDAIRPWQHVLEPLAGYLLLAQKLFTQEQQWAHAWNFGPCDSDAHPVSWIVNKFISEAELNIDWVRDKVSQPHEAQSLKLDSSKARNLLGWKNVWPIDTCIKEIAHWNTQWLKGYDMNNEVGCTIERYLQAHSYPSE